MARNYYVKAMVGKKKYAKHVKLKHISGKKIMPVKGIPFNIYHNLLKKTLDSTIPVIKVKGNSAPSTTGWITKGIKKSSDTKRDLFIELSSYDPVKNNKQVDDNLYKKYSDTLKTVVEIAKRKHTEKKILNSSNILRATWSLINENVKESPDNINNFVGLTNGILKATDNQ